MHLGAWTAVDACEGDPDRAMAVNALGDVRDHEALGGVGDLRLVAELGRPARAAHPDRARVGIDQ